MIHFLLLFSRQGKVRLQKWYSSYTEKQKKKYLREIISMIFARKPKMCSFLEWQDMKVVYRRYASLYFACAIDSTDNELITLEIIHRYVEILDKYFGNVCELDIIFHFEKAYFVLDEYLLAGEVQETGTREILSVIDAQDIIQEDEVPQKLFEDQSLN
ncbi:AP-1 complex subunit sigma-2 [Fasciola hepatica]|uniref:AP complex subunit sigma n=1 Tax=Fasciola hepatica TaxID=6192 RepID=A0A2H1BSX5_FASHE|nr:AP-1 complex subunit sigma-2 [Fasciola hepatica]